MTFATSARTDMAGIARSAAAGHPIKVFHHSGGWSVECPDGLLSDAGTDQFSDLEPLLAALQNAGIGQVIVQL